MLDSEDTHRRVWSEWADSVNLDFDTVWAASHGRRIHEMLTEVAPHFDIEHQEAPLRQMMLECSDGFPAQPYAQALLTSLPKESWALVTSAQGDRVRERFARVGLPIPAVLIDNQAVSLGKPHPEGYLTAVSALGCSPRDCLVVEDAPVGVTAGKAAGMTVIALGTTHRAVDLQHADEFEASLRDASSRIRLWLDGARPGTLLS